MTSDSNTPYNHPIRTGETGNGGEVMKEMLMSSFLAAATAADFKWQRIPNELILMGYLMGFMVRLSGEGIRGAVEGMCAGLITIAAFYIFYLMGAVGAGDIKLLSTVGLTMGFGFAARCAFFSLMAAGVAALIFSIKKGQLFLRGYLLFSHIAVCVRKKKMAPYSALEQEGYLHYALYISIGFMVSLIYRKEFP